MGRARGARDCILILAVAAACAASIGARPATAAGGAFVVEDADVDDVGECKVESWASFADNRDFIGVVSPTCSVNLGRPVEIEGQFSRFREAGKWGSSFSLSGKTNLIPIEPGKIGVSLLAGANFDFNRRAIDSIFVTIPVTLQLHETLRINLNAGWQVDPSMGSHAATWGAGFAWTFAERMSVIGEVFGQAGSEVDMRPRAQLGLRFTPQESFDIDVIYGRNIKGENANWITVGLNVRFKPQGNGKPGGM